MQAARQGGPTPERAAGHVSRQRTVSRQLTFFIGAPQQNPAFGADLPHFPHLY